MNDFLALSNAWLRTSN